MVDAVASDAEVGHFIAEDWAEDLHDNTQGQIEAAVEAHGMMLATQFELRFGDDAVLSLAETYRQLAEKIEKRLGEFIQKDRQTAKRWAERYGENH